MPAIALARHPGPAVLDLQPPRRAVLRRVEQVASASPLPGGMHAAAVAIGLSGYGVFLIASWVGWAFGYTALLITVVYGLSLMYFGLLVGLGRSAAAARGDIETRSFRDFMRGRVATLTGAVDGRNALVQVAVMPVVLGLTMVFFAVVWRTIAH